MDHFHVTKIFKTSVSPETALFSVNIRYLLCYKLSTEYDKIVAVLRKAVQRDVRGYRSTPAGSLRPTLHVALRCAYENNHGAYGPIVARRLEVHRSHVACDRALISVSTNRVSDEKSQETLF